MPSKSVQEKTQKPSEPEFSVKLPAGQIQHLLRLHTEHVDLEKYTLISHAGLTTELYYSLVNALVEREELLK